MNKQKPISDSEAELLGRVMPHAMELEEAIIGAILLESNALEIVQGIITSPKAFYEKAIETIYETVLEMSSARKRIDLVTVMENLHGKGLLEQVGGAHYLVTISQKVVSSANLEYHCRIVQQKFISREAIRIGSEMIDKAFTEAEDIDDTLNDASKSLQKLQEATLAGSEKAPISALMSEAVEEMYQRMEKYEKGVQTGINTGVGELNRVTAGGWQGSNLIILAARPGAGKTACAIAFAKAAAKSGVPVLIFELEMKGVRLADRLLMSEMDINTLDYKKGKLTSEQASKADEAMGKLYKLPIEVDNTFGATMDYITNRCRMQKKAGKCGMVIIDYLQLIKSTPINKTQNREQQVAEISRSAKLLANDLDVPVIMLAQLNREVDKRTVKKPLLSDLRESGAIEQDADIVLFVHRQEYYDDTRKGIGNFIIAKYREGAVGEIDFAYNESMTKIFDVDTRGYAAVAPAGFVPVNYNEPEREQGGNMPF